MRGIPFFMGVTDTTSVLPIIYKRASAAVERDEDMACHDVDTLLNLEMRRCDNEMLLDIL